MEYTDSLCRHLLAAEGCQQVEIVERARQTVGLKWLTIQLLQYPGFILTG